jgi:steroid 5-alpha reductase family enzyme
MITNFWVTALVALAVVLVTFAIGVSRGKHRYIDIAWGLGFAAIAVTSYLLSAGAGDPGLRALVTLLTVVWGVRLAVHIGRRSWGKGEDPRYAQLLSKAKGSGNGYALRMVYLLQAAIMWFVSLPVQVVQYDPGPLSWWVVPGIVLWGIGFFFEAVGDFQLARFSRDPASKGKVLDTGLWRYTRHPNYFGDACVWWGLYLLALGSWAGAATILSPVLMTYFLAGKTGKPLLEKGMKQTRPGYADYARRTSGFFPLPPKRST